MTMAYLDLAARLDDTPGAHARTTASGIDRGFTAREWQVIAIARADGLSSLREETPLKSFLRHVFGFERQHPLANPRLEALRRIAVLSWHHGYTIAGSELNAFVEAGYAIDQYDALLAHVGRERATSIRKTRLRGARS